MIRTYFKGGDPLTREQLAEKIRWERVIWTAGIVNVTAMLPQLWSLLTTKATEGLSLGMFLIYLGVQVAFCLEGYFKRNAILFWCLGASAVVNATIICLILCYRHG